MDPSFVGRVFPLDEPYLVGREKIREFAAAIGDTGALSTDVAAARAAGYPDLVAPPTFAMAAVAKAQEAVLFNPELGLDFSRVVHGDQSFTHHQPICAGAALGGAVHIDDIRQMAGNDILKIRTELTDAHGAAVTTAIATLVSRGGDA